MKSFKLKNSGSHLIRNIRSLMLNRVDHTVDTSIGWLKASCVDDLMNDFHTDRAISSLIEDDLTCRFESTNK